MFWVFTVGNQTLRIFAPDASTALLRARQAFPGQNISEIRESNEDSDRTFRVVADDTVDAIRAEVNAGTPPSDGGDSVTVTPPETPFADTPEGPIVGLSERQIALDQLLASAGGRRSIFEGSFGIPSGASGFLRRGLEDRFAPTDVGFQLQQVLGLRDQGDEVGARFPAFLRGLGGAVPSVSGIQGGISALLSAIQGEDEAGGVAREFIGDPNREFNVALQGSRLRQIAPFLRGSFTSAARRSFDRRLAAAPETTFLPGFAQRGFRF